MADDLFLTLTADIVSSHVSGNAVPMSDLPLLIRNVHDTLVGLLAEPVPVEVRQKPAVSIRASINPDYLICLEDGKKFKMLKRHLMTHYQMSPDAYREKWNLPSDYPMVAPSYAAKRSEIAMSVGLGRRRSASRKKTLKLVH